MWFAKDIFRLSYLPNVVIPILFAVFSSNDLTIINVMPYIIGWSFIMTYANLMNDFIDNDRKLPIGRKSLMVLSIVFLFLALIVLRGQIVYALTAIIGWAAYNWKVKGMVFFDIALIIALGILPYLNATTLIDFNIVGLFVMFGAITLLIDKMVDEPKYRKSFSLSRILVIITSVLLAAFLVYLNFINYATYWYLLSLIPFLVGIAVLFSFLTKHIKPSIKIIVVYSGNVLMFYLFAILIQMGKFI